MAVISLANHCKQRPFYRFTDLHSSKKPRVSLQSDTELKTNVFEHIISQKRRRN